MAYTTRPTSTEWPSSAYTKWPSASYATRPNAAYASWPGIANTPLTLPGATALAVWLRADIGVTLGATMRLDAASAAGTGAGGAITLANNLTSGLPVYVLGHAPGALGVGKIDVSIDGGVSWALENLTTSGTPTVIPGAGGMTIAVGAGTLVAGTVYNATVASWTDQKGAFVFSQGTASKQPIIKRSALGGQLVVKPDGVDDRLTCSTAGVAAWVSGNDVAFQAFLGCYTAGTLAGNKVFFSADGSASTTALWDCYTAIAAWKSTKGDNAGSFVSPAGGVVVLNTNYTCVDWRHTGTALTAVANGTTVINAQAQDLATASNIDQMSIGCSFANGVEANRCDHEIAEIIIYAGNQTAVTSVPVKAYMDARYSALANTQLAASNWNDSLVIASALPSTLPPNDYTNARWRRLRLTGSGALVVTSVPTIDAPAPVEPFDNISIWSDNVYTALLDYVGRGYGVRTSLTYTPADNNTHTLDVEDYASIVNFSGNYSVVTPVAPTNRVIIWGDSRVMPYGVTIPSNGYAQKMRHNLASTYGTTIRGISGDRAFDSWGDATKQAAFTATIQALADGTGKNILIMALDINDWSNGTTAVLFGSFLSAQIASLHAALPNLKILMLGSPTYSTEGSTNAGLATMDDYRTQEQAQALANPTFVTFLNLKTTCTYPGDFFDTKHPNNGGHVKLEAVVTPAVAAI